MNSATRDLCVLFADISGSSRLYEKLGDAEALHAVERCLNRMERAATAAKGRVVKTQGDELMVVFESAEAAAHAAIEIQRRVDALPPVSGVTLAIRLGFHYGPAMEEDGDVVGDTVNLASRLASLARPGQSLTTAETAALLPADLRERTRTIEALTVKGEDEMVNVFEILWAPGDEESATKFSAPPAVHAETRMRLRYGDQEVWLGDDRPSATFGRDPHADVVTQDSRASRNHGRIERRYDKYVLIDQSTNGTYVSFLGDIEFALRREEAILSGSCHISFGHATDGDKGELLEFEVLG
jgi:class 3 adenylate cyclase